MADPPIPSADAALSEGPATPPGSVNAAKWAQLQAPSAASREKEEAVSVPLSVIPEIQGPSDEAKPAGFGVEIEPAEARGGVFAAVEELTSAGPAPLTAESVALAFQRDDRRYDNGFPLY